jgi:hypothetical protein
MDGKLNNVFELSYQNKDEDNRVPKVIKSTVRKIATSNFLKFFSFHIQKTSWGFGMTTAVSESHAWGLVDIRWSRRARVGIYHKRQPLIGHESFSSREG